MKNEIKTTGTEFDVDLAMVDVAGAIYVAVSHLNNLYVSIHPTVWHENDAAQAKRISAEVKSIIDKLQNTEERFVLYEELPYDLLDREIDHLNNLYVSIHPAVWHENDAVEAIRISEEIKFIKNKLIYIKALGYKLDAYRDENE